MSAPAVFHGLMAIGTVTGASFAPVHPRARAATAQATCESA